MIFHQVTVSRNSGTDLDGKYLFSDEERPDQCWEGKTLSKIMTQVSMRYLGGKLSLWSNRQVIVTITRRYVKEVAGFFGGGDHEWERHYERDKGKDVYVWQTGHMKTTNTAIYGLDIAYPSQLQLDEYRRISARWQQWLGFLSKEAIAMSTALETQKKNRRMAPGADEESELVDELMSPECQKLKKMANDLARLMELRREERLFKMN